MWHTTSRIDILTRRFKCLALKSFRWPVLLDQRSNQGVHSSHRLATLAVITQTHFCQLTCPCISTQSIFTFFKRYPAYYNKSSICLSYILPRLIMIWILENMQVLNTHCLSLKVTKSTQSFGEVRLNRNTESQQVWHDKDPSLLNANSLVTSIGLNLHPFASPNEQTILN